MQYKLLKMFRKFLSNSKRLFKCLVPSIWEVTIKKINLLIHVLRPSFFINM